MLVNISSWCRFAVYRLNLTKKKISLSIASAYNWFGLQSFLWPPDIRREGGCGSSAWILMIITQSSPG